MKERKKITNKQTNTHGHCVAFCLFLISIAKRNRNKLPEEMFPQARVIGTLLTFVDTLLTLRQFPDIYESPCAYHHDVWIEDKDCADKLTKQSLRKSNNKNKSVMLSKSDVEATSVIKAEKKCGIRGRRLHNINSQQKLETCIKMVATVQ